MFASLARTASLALVAVALHGCVGPDDQQLLLEDGSDDAPWTTCTNEAMVLEGQNGDACTFDGPMGESCSHREDPIAADFTSNTCLDGRLLKGAAIVIASSYPEGRCLEPNVFDSYGMGFDVQTSTGGCLEVARCMWPDHDSLWQLCPAPVAEGVRPDAAGVAPWADCEAAIQGAADRDPCTGDFFCAAPRELAPSTHTDTLAARCDQGVLRLYDFGFFHTY